MASNEKDVDELKTDTLIKRQLQIFLEGLESFKEFSRQSFMTFYSIFRYMIKRICTRVNVLTCTVDGPVFEKATGFFDLQTPCTGTELSQHIGCRVLTDRCCL